MSNKLKDKISTIMPRKSFKIPTESYFLMFFAIVALVIIHVFKVDFIIADWIYLPTNSWQYQDSWITNTLMHRIGKYAVILLYLILLIKFFVRDKSQEDGFQRYGKIVLLSSLLVGTFVVSSLKHLLQVDCPWDLLQYGGNKPFFQVFQYGKQYLPSSHCFPSGHASTAFTWFSLYFYSSIYYPKQRLKVLAAILILGFTFGLGQQFRGAHFISHDIWSMLVCLSVNIVIYKLAFRKN
ncbi:MAG TPA: phosphatase PAP2 family protein [Oceanospirillales bacterium]|nr:phosphatase PAP2 family protein [Oceanospirillales bacterium]